MSRSLPLLAGAAIAMATLGACRDWNEKTAEFASLAEFKASEYGQGGYLPSNLVPPSARNFHLKYNIDSTEVDAKFDFAAADAERVITPFRTPEQIRLHELEKEGTLPPSKVSSPLFVRCAGEHVEFLQITGMRNAHYWTSWDREVRAKSCTPGATGPTI